MNINEIWDSFWNWISQNERITILVGIATIIDIFLTFLTNRRVTILSRKPDFEKISHQETLKFIKKCIDETNNSWESLKPYREMLKKKRENFTGKLIFEDQEKVSVNMEPSANFGPHKNLYRLNQQAEKKLKKLIEDDPELKDARSIASEMLKPILIEIRNQYKIISLFLPKQHRKILGFINEQDLGRMTLDIIMLDEESINKAIEYIYKYLRVIELAYYSGINPKLKIKSIDVQYNQKRTVTPSIKDWIKFIKTSISKSTT
jgi:hypothetical protein